jgi:hypothetical protein
MFPLFPTPCPIVNATAFASAMHSVSGSGSTRKRAERRGSHKAAANWTLQSYRSLVDQRNLIPTV